jgi:GNAT superfamily N-acetyltransferase
LKDWHIRLMEPQDRDRYLEFLGQQITRLPLEQRYQWLYCDNPHGRAITWLAMHNQSNEIIGCTSAFPRKMWIGGKAGLGCGGGDALVNPAFRRQGIATALHHTGISGMRDAGIEFLYGFPNIRNLGAFLKAGAHHPWNVRGMHCQIRRGERLAEKLKLNSDKAQRISNAVNRVAFRLAGHNPSRFRHLDREIREISSFDERFDSLMDEVGSTMPVCGMRDSKYLDWRYFQNPAKAHTILARLVNGELRGFAALEFTQDKCYIIDIFARDDTDSVEKLIAGVLGRALELGTNVIMPIINPKGPYLKQLIRWGFKPGADEYPFMILPTSDNRNIEHLTDSNNWYVSYADHDMEALSLGE